MWPVMRYLSYRACYADALFVSALQRSDEPDAEQVRRAVAAAISAFGAPAALSWWRRSLATIPRRRSSGCAGPAWRSVRRSGTRAPSPARLWIHLRDPDDMRPPHATWQEPHDRAGRVAHGACGRQSYTRA